MRLLVSGELRQSTNTSEMIYNIWQQISHLSQVMTLEPGDLIVTGTCANVGMTTGNCCSRVMLFGWRLSTWDILRTLSSASRANSNRFCCAILILVAHTG
ncbi:fumarylacetoacetate hydrolase family protein [Marinobacter alexandrii]|uniref:fumarylacetoacetate hydrolase family protein n=1 Tax=Marinobacter alexandrii TaxID=2570351 RepID=UPI003CD0C96E